MKTKFTINRLVFSNTEGLEASFADYEKYYKHYGWLLNKEEQEVFKIIDRRIDFLKEGDMIGIEGVGLSSVHCKFYNVTEDMMEYAIEQD